MLHMGTTKNHSRCQPDKTPMLGCHWAPVSIYTPLLRSLACNWRSTAVNQEKEAKIRKAEFCWSLCHSWPCNFWRGLDPSFCKLGVCGLRKEDKTKHKSKSSRSHQLTDTVPWASPNDLTLPHPCHKLWEKGMVLIPWAEHSGHLPESC